MLREFLVNTYPNAGRVQGSRPCCVLALVTWLKGINLPKICLLWFACVGTLAWGKLIDDLCPS